MSSYPSFLSSKSTQIILNLASAYGFDLSDTHSDIYLRLEQKSYLPLVLEKHEPYVFSLTHYYEQQGDLMSDPDISFLLRPSNDRSLIYPLAITQSNLGLYQEVAFLNRDRNSLHQFQSRALRSLVNFCNTWADNLKAQNWFLDKARPNPKVIHTT